MRTENSQDPRHQLRRSHDEQGEVNRGEARREAEVRLGACLLGLRRFEARPRQRNSRRVRANSRHSTPPVSHFTSQQHSQLAAGNPIGSGVVGCRRSRASGTQQHAGGRRCLPCSVPGARRGRGQQEVDGRARRHGVALWLWLARLCGRKSLGICSWLKVICASPRSAWLQGRPIAKRSKFRKSAPF